MRISIACWSSGVLRRRPLINKFRLRSLHAPIRPKLPNHRTTVIFMSQVRSNSKKAEAPAHIAKYLPDYVAQGAWAAKDGRLIDVMLKPGQKEKEKLANEPMNLGQAIEQKKRLTQVGKLVGYEITKGKAGIHEGINGGDVCLGARGL